ALADLRRREDVYAHGGRPDLRGGGGDGTPAVAHVPPRRPPFLHLRALSSGTPPRPAGGTGVVPAALPRRRDRKAPLGSAVRRLAGLVAAIAARGPRESRRLRLRDRSAHGRGGRDLALPPQPAELPEGVATDRPGVRPRDGKDGVGARLLRRRLRRRRGRTVPRRRSPGVFVLLRPESREGRKAGRPGDHGAPGSRDGQGDLADDRVLGA